MMNLPCGCSISANASEWPLSWNPQRVIVECRQCGSWLTAPAVHPLHQIDTIRGKVFESPNSFSGEFDLKDQLREALSQVGDSILDAWRKLHPAKGK